jgi:hypothetical protein
MPSLASILLTNELLIAEKGQEIWLSTLLPRSIGRNVWGRKQLGEVDFVAVPEIQFVGDSPKYATGRAKREEIRTIIEGLAVEESLGLWQEAGRDHRQNFIRKIEDGARIVVRHAEDGVVVVVVVVVPLTGLTPFPCCRWWKSLVHSA